MRKFLVGLAALAIVGVACGSNNAGSSPSSAASSPSAALTAADCAKNVTLTTPGTLTIGTDNPAYGPYFAGGSAKGSMWKVNDPNNDKGFEDTVAYAVADKLGFSPSQVTWVVAPFVQTYAPGAKKWDFAIEQISYSAKRAQAVDLTDGYYDVNQALVAVKGTPITNATSTADLKGYKLAAPLGTTSYDYIQNQIQPTQPAAVYQKLSDTVAALNAGQVDGIVVDLPTALYLADPYVQEVKNSTVVGQFPNPPGETPEHFSMALAKGSSLTTCVNQAIDELKQDGTLAALTTEWLSEKTNVGSVPMFSS